MIISEIGHIAGKYWAEIPNHFPFVQLGKFIIMPNHVHGIIIIDKSDNDGNAVETQNFRDAKFCVSTGSQKGRNNIEG
jgi:REP element-mobilizing transposase RayT